MRGLVLEGVGRIGLRDDLPEPTLEDPLDALVAVTAAGLCGSDLHPYRGHEPARPGVVPGHEVVGHVTAVGPQVRSVAPGDRVLAAFTTSCGTCPPCRRGLTARCGQGRLFGWGAPDAPPEGALHGGQAERIRIPLADGTLVRVPEQVDDATALLLTDNLPTGLEAVQRTGVRTGDALVVVGLGSVGLCAVAAALHLGADPVVGVDPVADRRERAERLGAARAVEPEQAVDALAEIHRDRGRPAVEVEPTAPAVIDAAGNASGQRLAFDLTRPGGTCSIIAVQTTDRFAFTPVEAYDRNVGVRVGRASARATLEDLLPRVAAGEYPVPTGTVMTHLDVALEDGPALYERFDRHEDGLVKAMLRP